MVEDIVDEVEIIQNDKLKLEFFIKPVECYYNSKEIKNEFF